MLCLVSTLVHVFLEYFPGAPTKGGVLPWGGPKVVSSSIRTVILKFGLLIIAVLAGSQ